MKKETYRNKMQKQIDKFKKIHSNMVSLTEEFFKDENNRIDANYDEIIKNMEQFLFTYAYVIDKLLDYTY